MVADVRTTGLTAQNAGVGQFVLWEREIAGHNAHIDRRESRQAGSKMNTSRECDALSANVYKLINGKGHVITTPRDAQHVTLLLRADSRDWS